MQNMYSKKWNSTILSLKENEKKRHVEELVLFAVKEENYSIQNAYYT